MSFMRTTALIHCPTLVTERAEVNPDDPEWKRLTDEIATVINSVDADTAYLDPKIVLEEFLAHLPAEMIEAVWFVIRYTYKISEDAIEKRREHEGEQQ